MTLLPLIIFVIGLVLLIRGGDWFVDGATDIACRFHMSELFIGATVVSIGTTLPEVMVSATSAIEGHSEIAYGNATGSVICNTALIAAIIIAVRPGKVERRNLCLPLAFFFAAALFFSGNAYLNGGFSRITGIILLAVFFAYMFLSLHNMRKNQQISYDPGEEAFPDPENESREAPCPDTPLKTALLLIFGAVFIAAGAYLLVESGSEIARDLGVSEAVIALTIIALGTSLPEITTAVISLVKGYSVLSIGNIIGANLFNLVLVCGVSVTLSPFAIPEESFIFGHNASLVLDLPMMFLCMLLLTVPALVKQKFYRAQGILLIILYLLYFSVLYFI